MSPQSKIQEIPGEGSVFSGMFVKYGYKDITIEDALCELDHTHATSHGKNGPKPGGSRNARIGQQPLVTLLQTFIIDESKENGALDIKMLQELRARLKAITSGQFSPESGKFYLRDSGKISDLGIHIAESIEQIQLRTDSTHWVKNAADNLLRGELD